MNTPPFIQSPNQAEDRFFFRPNPYENDLRSPWKKPSLEIQKTEELFNSTVYANKTSTEEKLKKQLKFAKKQQEAQTPTTKFQFNPQNYQKYEEVKLTHHLIDQATSIEKAAVAQAKNSKYKKSMEDTFILEVISFLHQNKNYSVKLYGILDGHSLLQNKGIAAAIYVKKNFPLYLKKNLEDLSILDDQTITNSLVQLFSRLNQECIEQFPFCGTTITCVLEFKNKIYNGNIGDSRTILVFCNPDREGRGVQLTEDAKINVAYRNLGDDEDSYLKRFEKALTKAMPLIEEKAQNLIKNQQIPPSHKDAFRKREFGIKSLKNSDGSTDYRFHFPHESSTRGYTTTSVARNIGLTTALSFRPKITLLPDDAKEGDYLILACDGLWDVATTDQVGKAINLMEKEGYTPAQMSEALVSLALKFGSYDNISVMVVKL
jgi:serine/threonine protein phosphatase PrpC